MRVFSLLPLCCILCVFCFTAFGQETATTPRQAAETATTAPNACAWLPTDVPHVDALRGVCEYSITLPDKMPNFICDQAVTRSHGESRSPAEVITATVRYEEGDESYSDIKMNGVPAPPMIMQSTGLWSVGEFGSKKLRAIFNQQNQAQFKFVREGKIGDRSAWVFTYQIVKQTGPRWMLHVGDQAIAPPYKGELWIDQKTGEVLRFESVAQEIPKSFPMSGAQYLIDYERVAFADRSWFVLPTHFVVTAAIRGGEETRNIVRLRNCHIFRAQARIVADSEMDQGVASPGTDATVLTATTLASLKADLNESETFFAAIGEQVLRDDEIRQEAEQKQMLDTMTASAFERLAVLRSEQLKIQAQPAASAERTAAVSVHEPLTTLTADVNLVPVSVVVRDATGRAVGRLVKDNFRLFDEGKPQVITHFSIEPARHGTPGEEMDAASVRVQDATRPDTTPRDAVEPKRATAYLFDDIHLSFSDMSNAREAAGRHLGSLQAGERAAVFTTSGAVAVEFSSDLEKLLDGLRRLKPRPMIPEPDCPRISHYMADLMVNKRDPDANDAAVAEVQNCALRSFGFSGPEARRLASHAASEVLYAGNTESKNSLAVLRSVIRSTDAAPGQRSIVLVSPGFLALTADTHEDLMAIVDGAVRTGIVINTLDAHGLYTGGFSANSTPGNLRFDIAEAQARGEVMSEIASGTGGMFFHNNSNLDEGFRRTADAPEFVYVLGFSPQKLDGKYHELKVVLNGAAKLDIQSRRGYYAFKPAPSK